MKEAITESGCLETLSAAPNFVLLLNPVNERNRMWLKSDFVLMLSTLPVKCNLFIRANGNSQIVYYLKL
jgi:hypothetical protein